MRICGLPSLFNNPPLRDGPALLLQASSAHRERVIARMVSDRHQAESPIFAEDCQKNDSGVLLFRPRVTMKPSKDGATTLLDSLLTSVLTDSPLCCVLSRMPFIASSCTESLESVEAAFTGCCTAAFSASRTLKLSAPQSVRRRLLDAALNTPAAACLTPSPLHAGVFSVAGVYRSAAFFYSHTASAPFTAAAAESSSSSAAAAASSSLEHPAGHWRSSASHDKSGVQSSICRAYFKLSELLYEDSAIQSALAALTIDATAAFSSEGANAQPSCCIDIGASPGGWTDLLSSRFRTRVVAVDPGALNTDLTSRANVVHLRMLLGDEESMVRLRQALLPAKGACCVVCDANIPAANAGGLIASLASHGLLLDGCKIVLTLKAPDRVRASQGAATRQQQMADAAGALGACFEAVRLRQLFANTQHEATLTAAYVRPGPEAARGPVIPVVS